MCTIAQDTSGCNIATINPFRYRGYYYDVDTGMYYLQSRYYNPVVGRFVNGDEAEFASVEGSVFYSNLFCYCENDCSNFNDDTGYLSIKKFGNAVKNAIISFGSLLFKACKKVLGYFFEAYNPIKIQSRKIYINSWVISGVIDLIVQLVSQPIATSINSFMKIIKLIAKFSQKNVANFFKNTVVPFFAKFVAHPIKTFIEILAAFWATSLGKTITNDFIAYKIDKVLINTGTIANYVLNSISSFGTFLSFILDLTDNKLDNYYCLKMA